MTPQEGQDFFETYLTRWNAQDLEGISDLFEEPSLFVLPDRSIALATRQEALALLTLVFQGLNADNFEASRYASLEARSAGGGLAVLDVAGVDRLRKDGSLIETIDAHYILRRQAEGGWRIISAVVCEPGWRRG